MPGAQGMGLGRVMKEKRSSSTRMEGRAAKKREQQVSRHRGGRALAGEPDLGSRCQGCPRAKPVIPSGGSCRPRGRLCSICSGSRPSRAIRASPQNPMPARPPPLCGSPTHQHLPQGVCTAVPLPRTRSPQASLSLAIPPPSSRLCSLLLPSTPATGHPVIKAVAPAWRSPATLPVPPVGFVGFASCQSTSPCLTFSVTDLFSLLVFCSPRSARQVGRRAGSQPVFLTGGSAWARGRGGCADAGEGGRPQAQNGQANGNGLACQLVERDRCGLREGPTGTRVARALGSHHDHSPDDVGQGGEEGLHLVDQPVLGAQRLDQRRHPVVVVPGHRGEEAGAEGRARADT